MMFQLFGVKANGELWVEVTGQLKPHSFSDPTVAEVAETQEQQNVKEKSATSERKSQLQLSARPFHFYYNANTLSASVCPPHFHCNESSEGNTNNRLRIVPQARKTLSFFIYLFLPPSLGHLRCNFSHLSTFLSLKMS